MARLLSKHGIKTAAQQAAYFNARRRRESLHDPARGLYLTSTLTAAQGVFNSAARFLNPTADVTFAVDVDVAAGANGVLLDIGSTAGVSGCALVIDSAAGRVVFAAGDGPAGGNGLSISVAGLLAAGSRLRLVAALSAGAANLWLGGRLVGAAVSTSGPVNWVGNGNSGVGAVFGNLLARAPAGAAASLTNAVISGGVRVYLNQRPRGLQAAGKGTNNGNGAWSS